jgi:ABC-type sugar transport system ATPase subunit
MPAATSTPPTHIAPPGTEALSVSGIRKVFGGEVALNDVGFTVSAGEIHALLGANGAGKSTLVKIISGAEAPDAGEVRINGQTLPAPHSPAQARDAGCAYIHQDRALVPDLTVAENIALGLGFPLRSRLISNRATLRQAQAALDRVGLEVDPETLVNELPVAEQTLTAIARSLAADARLLLLDEPTATLGADDAAMLYQRLQELRTQGTACLLITHALDEALQHSDRVTVLRDGHLVATRASDGLSALELTRLMIGPERATEVATQAHGRRRAAGRRILGLHELSVVPGATMSFDVEAGEIVALTGLPDSGHLAVGEIVFGARKPLSGSMSIGRAGYGPRNVADAIARKVAYVPSDRLRDGLAVSMTVRENLFMCPVDGGRGSETERCRKALIEHGVKPPDPDAEMSTLSGGNMQKVLLAKWLLRRPDLLVLAEPTVGVDIGARADIYRRLRESAEGGLGVLVITSDQDEVVALADRVLVLRFGSIAATLAGDQINAEAVAAATHGWHHLTQDP